MRRSLNTLQQVRQRRALDAPPAGAVGPWLVPEALLEVVRQRNAVLDWFFYDVGAVTGKEARDLSPWLAAEGAILVVPPTGAGTLERCASVSEFVAAGGGAVRTLVVAGVGSSALGSAALARNVADAMQAPVAAVVSGYGLADVAAEALGGFFWFGAINSVRHLFEWLDQLREAGAADPEDASLAAAELPTRQSRDTGAVRALLSHPALSFDLLVGHSKGNLVISEALYALQEDDGPAMQALGARTCIVTLGAKIAMPRACRQVIDVLGQFDSFGELNSRRWIPTDRVVENAGHHTNTEIPWHLPVTRVLEELRAEGSLAPASRRSARAAQRRTA
jgi:hypothetical protein